MAKNRVLKGTKAQKKNTKTRQIEIIPVILAYTKAELKEKLNLVENIVDTVQIDIEDGIFAPLKTIQAAQFRHIVLKPKIEIHLMVKNPIKYITDFARIGVSRILFHYESCKDDKEAKRLVEIIKSKGIEAGITIAPKTPASKIKKFLNEVDVIQVLTIHIGFAGQKFLPKQLRKVRQIRQWSKKIPIEVDGGVHVGTACECAKAGATRLAAGSAIWNSENPRRAIEELLQDARCDRKRSDKK